MKLLSRTKDVFKLVRKAGDDRVTNNGLCNLGRSYQGLGDIEKAKDYFKKAIETPRPPKAYWCDSGRRIPFQRRLLVGQVISGGEEFG